MNWPWSPQVNPFTNPFRMGGGFGTSPWAQPGLMQALSSYLYPTPWGNYNFPGAPSGPGLQTPPTGTPVYPPPAPPATSVTTAPPTPTAAQGGPATAPPSSIVSIPGATTMTLPPGVAAPVPGGAGAQGYWGVGQDGRPTWTPGVPAPGVAYFLGSQVTGPTVYVSGTSTGGGGGGAGAAGGRQARPARDSAAVTWAPRAEEGSAAAGTVVRTPGPGIRIERNGERTAR